MHNKILGFDALRGFSVIAVVLTHLHVFKWLEEHRWLSAGAVELFKGTTGVQIFFVLSGFLITMLLIKEFEANDRISYKSFVIRRALRIFPVYFLLLFLLTAAFLYTGNEKGLKSLIYAYTYVYNFVSREEYVSIIGHTWSLAVEEHFYLVWPLLFAYLAKKTMGSLKSALLVFIALSFLLGHWLIFKTDLHSIYFVDRWTIIAGSNIAYGCLFALILYPKKDGQNNLAIKNALATNKSLLIAVVAYCNSLYLPAEWWLASGYIRGLGIGMFVAWIALNQTKAAVKWLEFRPLAYVGQISYGIYVYQGLFLSTTPVRHPGQFWPPDPMLGVLGICIAAPLSYHFFEKPLLSFKKKFALQRGS